MDPLSVVLSLLNSQTYMVRGFDAAGHWSVLIGPHDGIKCFSLLSGECWLSVEGVAEPVHLKAGDCVLWPSARASQFATDLALEPVASDTVIAKLAKGEKALINGGGDFFGISGWFVFAGHNADMLLNLLPPIVHIRQEADKAALRYALEALIEELRESLPGGDLAAQHLAHLVMIRMLRVHLSEGQARGVGWLYALADPEVGPAINAIHQDAGHHWTLSALAECAGMSRSSFAQKFKEAVGSTPIDYLTGWRMRLAADRIKSSNDSISSIAHSLGYSSEAAFGAAFRRVMKCSPRRYGRARGQVSGVLEMKVEEMEQKVR